MPAIIEEIGPHPVYDREGQHDETFAQIRFYDGNGRAYASLRIHVDAVEGGAQVGDEVRLIVKRKVGK